MDLVHSKLIVVWGANPGASNTHLQPIITQAKKNGAVVVVIDPRRISAADRADLHIALRPGTDVVFGYAVARWINEHNRVDNNFVAQHVTGAEQFLLAANEWTLERASEVCGVSVADIERFAELVTAGRIAVDSEPMRLLADTALIARRRGVQIDRTAWIGIAIALVYEYFVLNFDAKINIQCR